MPPEKMSDESEQKWQAIFAEYGRTQKTYSTMGALHSLAQYWVENEIIIERAAKNEADENGPKWKPNWNDADSVGEWHSERDIARDMHDKTMIPMHRFSCIVMLYSTIERELLRLVENLEKEDGPQKLKWKNIRADSKVEQISKFCEVFFGFRLADCSQYNAVTELQKIRDCIIHCLGDVGLSADKDFLVKLRDKRRGFIVHPNNDIHIDEECIKQFLVEIWAFFVSVFDTLKWEIASHWQGDKLGKAFERLTQ
ncbi:MAG TPA: hypothetical protein VGN23_09375 [Verrucomicrobiae bacterium]